MNQEDLVKQKEEEMMKYSSFAEPDSDEAKKYKDAKKAYDAERKNLRRTKEEVEELRIDLKRAKNIGLAEAKSSGQAAAAEVVQDEIDDKKEEIENIEAEIKRIESDVIPKDEEDVAAAKHKKNIVCTVLRLM